MMPELPLSHARAGSSRISSFFVSWRCFHVLRFTRLRDASSAGKHGPTNFAKAWPMRRGLTCNNKNHVAKCELPWKGASCFGTVSSSPPLFGFGSPAKLRRPFAAPRNCFGSFVRPSMEPREAREPSGATLLVFGKQIEPHEAPEQRTKLRRRSDRPRESHE